MARQGQIFLFSIVLYFFIRSSLIGSEELDGAYFTQVAFHKLEGNSLQTISVRSVLQCCMRCERVPECLSFNIAVLLMKNGLYECVLLKNGTRESTEYLVPTQEYHHYTRFVDKCAIPRCKNNGACETVSNDFLCHCPQGFTGKLCEKQTCNDGNALGMESGVIPDSNINASSHLSLDDLPHHARLHGNKQWSPKVHDSNPWLQVDLGKVTMVSCIATQGTRFGDWTKTYSLQYGLNSSSFEDYQARS
ncbi:EGF-like repeat and discoidin I-like domain-containing protein 3 [Actinia tenebrosa]|uniref:EGF-like repeat and discoidin I-like domain-containing protein 3 n=1 Tax=Actinia tenebrosa TaxID=6105 RepID=A0A6P8ITZ1_ACTTE|nr:EGF-like repeat and discoidin I-like domain-containing protein 3 [Actinia tenebrosa]